MRTVIAIWLGLVVFAFPLCAGVAYGTELKITGKNGTTKVLNNAYLDYTNKNGIGLVPIDTESTGIRIYEESGKTIVPWTKIKSVTIIGEVHNVKEMTSETKATLLLTDGKRVPANVRFPTVCGTTDLGAYKVELSDLKKIEPIVDTSDPGDPSSAYGADLKITTMKGSTKVLKNAYLDYTSGFGIVRVDEVSTGIRIFDESGNTIVPWTKIKSVTVNKVVEKQTTSETRATLLLTNGKKVPANVGFPTVCGTTDLGAYKVELSDLKKIEPIEASSEPDDRK